MNQELALSQQEQELRQRLLQVLKGAPSGMDEDSLKAGAALLQEIETTQAILHLLQTRQLQGRVTESGEPIIFALPDDNVSTPEHEQAA